MTYGPPYKERLPAIAQSLKSGESVPPETVRNFLNWFFGTQRRGRWIVGFIREQLEHASLVTEPDFQSTYLDAEITFKLDGQSSSEPVQPPQVVADSVTVTDHTEVRIATVVFDDPTYRISKLGASNRRPISVKPDASVAQAVTLMMANDFSQLPVMTNERDVKGSVSWKSIGSRLAVGKNPQWVREVMEPHAELSGDASLFTAIRVIVDHDYALVRSSDQKVSGIITTSDLSLQFEQLSEPFLLLGEIENHLRKILGSKFKPDELATAKNPGDAERMIEAASDLTFGEYQRLFEDPDKWEQLNLNLDRSVFVVQLDKVRKIRNDVMHFDPDGIEDHDLETLRDFAKFLRLLNKIGAT